MTVPLPDLFKRVTLAPGGVRINTLIGGNETGTPVLLLHGYPQTHVMWHHVAPVLAKDHMVVLTDLRGYGDSGKPAGGPTHDAYAKRTMAYDQVLVMRELGFESFAVAGHDRGARVAHRMALDYRGRSASSPSWTSSPPGTPCVPPTRTSASATGTGSSSPSRNPSPSTRSAPTRSAGCAAG